MAVKSTGRKVTPNGYEWYKPIYNEPVVVEKKVDLSVYGIKGRYVDMTFNKLKAQGAPVEDRQAYTTLSNMACMLESISPTDED